MVQVHLGGVQLGCKVKAREQTICVPVCNKQNVRVLWTAQQQENTAALTLHQVFVGQWCNRFLLPKDSNAPTPDRTSF